MDAPEFPGAYFDGEDATRRPVRVRAAGGALHLRREDGGEVCWPRRSYRLVQGRYAGEPLRFERGLEALVVEDHGLLAALGRRSWPFVPVALGSAAVVGLSLLVFYFFGLPALCASVARHVPRSWEEQLGQSALAELAPPARRCSDPAANQALTAIAAQLTAGGGSPTPQVILLQDDMVNAFALPGGTVVVSAGLLHNTRRPEELAGVLSHEIEHLAHRHPTQGLVRALSVNALVTVLSGDVSSLLAIAASAGELRYQRADERCADEDGLRRMQAAGIDGQGMVEVMRTLDRVGHDVPRQMRYLSSHPLTADRVAYLDRLARQAPGSPRPLLPGTDWARVARACAGP